MAMKIIDLPNGRVSLEFSPPERDAVLAAVSERCGSYELTGTYELVTGRGERFAYVDEWDEPCLISIDPSGDELLREIVGRHLKSSKRRPAIRKIDSPRPLGHS